jgi:hypothetical protein
MGSKIIVILYILMMTLVVVVLGHAAYNVVFVDDKPAFRLTAEEFCKGIDD